MKKFRIIILVFGGIILTYLGAKTIRSVSVISKPAELRTDHFIISYQGIFRGDAQDIADNLEKNYNRIRENLHDPAHEVIRVFVHPTQSDFNKGTGLLNSTANGTSRGPNEFHFIWTNWFNSIFPNDPLKTAVHEFTHCVQLNILVKQAQQELATIAVADFDENFEKKFARDYPQWFWEALSIYHANEVNKISVKYARSKNPSLEYLSNNNQIYNIGYTIIEYIVEKWGVNKLPDLITSYVDIEEVLKVSQADFEKGWTDFVDEKY